MSDLIVGLYEDWLWLDERIETITNEIEKIAAEQAGVDPFPWTVHGLGGSGQLMMKPFVLDRREVAQRRMAA